MWPRCGEVDPDTPCPLAQGRKASEKQRELDKAKEKQQEELNKQKQIEKVGHSDFILGGVAEQRPMGFSAW